MKAYEFPATVTADGKLEVPAAMMETLPRGKTVRLIVLVGETAEEEKDWQLLTTEQFFAGYSQADAIYDKVV
jgi:hypothetical protein